MSTTSIPEKQVPGPDEIFLDHLGWFVPDIDHASLLFDKLGFLLTPYTVHMNEQPDGSRVPSGTANRCAMIQRGYLEILTRVPDVDSAITRQMDAGLARYTGLHLIAFTVADTADFTKILRESGFEPDPPVALRRPMTLDDGSEDIAAFSVVRLPSSAMAEGRVQVLSQDTPEVVWQSSLTCFENGAELLSGVLIVSVDPVEAVNRYQSFTGRLHQRWGSGYRIILDRGELVFCSPTDVAQFLPETDIPSLPFIAAVSIRSKDLELTRQFLNDAHITFRSSSPSRIVVDNHAGVGSAFVFHSNDTTPFSL